MGYWIKELAKDVFWFFAVIAIAGAVVEFLR
jgi:hypothetical protein